MAPPRVLIIDDEPEVARSIGHYLEDRGHAVAYAQDGAAGLTAFAREAYDVVISDVRMPGGGGLELLRAVKERSPETAVIMITGYATTETVIEALKAGAADFLQKPIDLSELSVTLERVRRLSALERANEGYRERLARAGAEARRRGAGTEIVGESPGIDAVRALIARAAASPTATVLVTGESGTGKELVARSIHEQSRRANGPLVSVNCSGFTESIIESELFGHERGAFTGADRVQKGVFELADGGTLFLDEIGDMPLGLQGRLLRVLEEQVVRRIGGQRTIRVDFRLVSATNRDLEALAATGAFRKDLYYRLSGFTIRLPPLCERPGDVLVLARRFLALAAAEQRKPVSAFAEDAVRLLEAHDYPGNVRELRNLVESAVILADGQTVTAEHLPSLAPGPAGPASGPSGGGSGPGGVRPVEDASRFDLAQLEAEAIARAVAASGGDLKAAARLLNIGYGALRYRLGRSSRS